jgi:hypothetical protein
MPLLVLAAGATDYVSLILYIDHFDLDPLSKFLVPINSIALEPTQLELQSSIPVILGTRVFLKFENFDFERLCDL